MIERGHAPGLTDDGLPDGRSERLKSARGSIPDGHDLRAASELLKTLGDPTRMRILSALSREELSVSELQEVLELSQSAVSHQLKVLRDADMVDYRREGKMVYYSLADEHVYDLVRTSLEHVRHY
jgi:DNA-binding transcriptional ArsR family regulator